MPAKPFTTNIAHPFHNHPPTTFEDVELGLKAAIPTNTKDENSPPKSKLREVRRCLSRHSLGLLALFFIVAGGIAVPVTLYRLHKLH